MKTHKVVLIVIAFLCFGCAGPQTITDNKIHHLENQVKQNQDRIHTLYEDVSALHQKNIFLYKFARKVCEDAYDPGTCFERFPELY